MEEQGLVLENRGDEALVKITRHSLCSRCAQKCPMASMEHETDEIEVLVSNPVGAEKGQLVKIEMGEKSLVTASLLIYLVPVIFLIAGYFAGIYLSGFIYDTTPGKLPVSSAVLYFSSYPSWWSAILTRNWAKSKNTSLLSKKL